MNTVILSLGTNQGNKLENLNIAIKKLSLLGEILTVSSIYQTPPWGFKSDDFYNMALSLKTEIEAEQLIEKLQAIETSLGREKKQASEGYQARPLDIDIIFYNNDILDSKNLTIPHPRMQERKFVLIPIIEIISNFIHPTLKVSLEHLLTKTNDTSEIVKTSEKISFIKKASQL